MASWAKVNALFLLISFFWLLALGTRAAAQVPVVELDSIDSTTTGISSLHSYNPGTGAPPNEVHVASYHCYAGSAGQCLPDGGEGLMIYHGTGCRASNEIERRFPIAASA